MMRSVIGVCLALALCAPVWAADSQLRRLTLRSQSLGWEAVGRLDIANSGFCTGVLIATDLVLTAAHCVVSKSETPHEPSDLIFRAGYADGAVVAERKGAAFVAHPRYLEPRDRADQLRHDVALVKLAASIPAATAAPFAVGRMPRRGAELSVVSYARGRREAQSWQRRCRAVANDPGLLAVSCEATFGASGSPIFQRSGRRAQIVSMISSITALRGQPVALGMDLAGPLSDLKRALRSGRGVVTQAPPERRRPLNSDLLFSRP